jgi:hypothetical protein
MLLHKLHTGVWQTVRVGDTLRCSDRPDRPYADFIVTGLTQLSRETILKMYPDLITEDNTQEIITFALSPVYEISGFEVCNFGEQSVL